MSAGEIAFLGFGALLGGVGVGVLVGFVRARVRRPNVRLTVAPSTTSPLMATTLSAAVGPWSEAARGGPADPRILDSPGDGAAAAAGSGDSVGEPGPDPKQTPVLKSEPVAVSVEPEQQLDFRALIARRRATGPLLERGVRVGGAESAQGGLGAPVGPGVAVLESRPSEPIALGRADPRVTEPLDVLGAAEPSAPVSAEPAVDSPANPDAAAESPTPLDEHRRAVQERCAVAERLKATALVAADTLRSEQRAYDVCLEQIRNEELAVDGRAIRAAKDAAQLEFRRAGSVARSHADVEAAARQWLATIDSVNHAARVATVQLTRDRQAASRLAMRLERLSVEADAARIAAEAAAEACLAARQRLASAEQGIATEDETAAGGRAAAQARLIPLDPDAPVPFVVRLLRGDHAALLDIVGRLSGDDREEQRRWQLHLAAFVDGLVARALDMAWLDFPVDHPFWGMFSLQQDRDIAKSLGSLGYRYDGLGGFVDGRIPGQRELSLAVGYAGLDPMRIRRWPDQVGLAELYRGVRVEAAEYVAAEAPSLSLGQLVTMLGQRAEQLTDLWNNWGRIRPILLATA